MIGYSQTERMCRVLAPLGDDSLLLQQMVARESLSRLFRFDLTLVSEHEDLAFDQIVGKPIAIAVELQDRKQRWFHGIVSRFAQGAAQGRFVAYRAEVVPRLWLLTRRTNCRIFQHLSVPDIVRQILGEHGISDLKLELVASYPEREYCVQYRETDFDFVSRLMEHEGIGYFFEHEEKAHTFVMFDSPGAAPVCPDQGTAIYASASDEGSPSGDIYQLDFERELRPGAYALTDFNFEQPSLSLLSATTSGTCVGSNASLEVYDYPGSFLLPPDAETRVKCRMEAEECASVWANGESRCAAFAPGYRFDLRGHYRSDTNDTYLITEVEHRVVESSGETEGEPARYDNTFRCMPHAVPYRPLTTTHKPRIHGAQTATVVGAAGKEIDVDVHGRIVVQFHWDREGQRDENSSCRVRVAQNWAGKGWGLIAHPRIGQEVVIDFLEGDPDHPLVIGRVYNGEQTTPYALPANSTQTGVKSRSSPGGGGFNEWRFEDKAGSELVYIQAQKDRSTLTKNDDSQSVGHDRSRSVGNDESVDVGNDQKVTIGNNQTISVGTDRTRSVGSNESVSIGSNRTKDVGADETVSIGSNRSTTVGASHTESIGASETLSVGADRTRSVGGSETVTVTAARTHSVGVNEMINVGAAQEVTVGAARTLSVGAAQTTTIGAVHSVSVGANESIDVGGDRSLSVGGGQSSDIGADAATKAGGNYAVDAGKSVSIVAADEIVLKVGSAKLVMKKNGDILLDGKKINVKASGDIVMKGSKILQN